MPSHDPPKHRELALSLAAFALLFLTSFSPSTAIDAITPYQSLVDDGQTLISPGGVFELGFFSTQNGTSKTRYVGIFYTNIPDKIAVWVANRGAPLTGSGGILNLTNDGNLSLYDPTGVVLWSTTTSNVRNPVVQLLDSGSLVVTDSNSNTSVWQSFDHPGNLMLPGMRLGWDLRANLGWYLTSWKTTTDPSPGPYSFKMDPRGFIRELYLWNGTEVMCRIGWWNGYDLSGLPQIATEDYIKFSFTSNPDEASFTFELINSSIVSLLLLTESGVLQRLVWLNEEWEVYLQYPTDQCDMYAECGRYGLCIPAGSTVTSCQCLKGFRPRSKEEWDLRDWSAGCERVTSLNCSASGGDGFVKLSGLKLPETLNSTSVMSSMGLDECTDWCLKNCSCVAFAMISGEASGCITWFGDLIDIREITGAGDDLYLRLAASELDRKEANSNKKGHKVLVTIIVILGILFVILVALFLWKRKRIRGIIVDYHTNEISENELELNLFDLSTLQSATNDFFIENKLGEGGFGQVYKGQMGDGQEIAVKRLSKDSVQGLDEFKNEALLIAKLQHRNLVQLLGCCIQGDERMLVYEYMQNKSLDSFIFDQTKSASLDWQKRLDIILGIARGLLYLHQDSRFKIIHRDLKTSNILLDEEMNPKISDFGLARIFKGDQMQETTKRVFGTYGYMSPEYAMDGIFSVKSDVFSFGVIVLEILSGKKNRVTYGAEPNMNLLAHAWNLWKEDKCLELLDRTVQCSYPTSELLRCIQVGLLCVQEGRDDRPIMSSVVMMLSNEALAIPQPKKPGFSIKRITMESECSCSDQHSTNEVTITMLQGR